MEKIVVSVVNYTNSLPYIWGLEHSEVMKHIVLEKDTPSNCAQKLKDGRAHIGLVPVGSLSELKDWRRITDYGIGARGKVESVALFSEVPLNEIKEIVLDHDSRSSVLLLKCLNKYKWKLNVELKQGSTGFETEIGGKTAAMVIGDRALALGNKHKYKYDLAQEWTDFFGVPIVFAVWVSRTNLPKEFLQLFNHALKTGVEEREKLISQLLKQKKYSFDLHHYLMHNIQYHLEEMDLKGMEEFRTRLQNLMT